MNVPPHQGAAPPRKGARPPGSPARGRWLAAVSLFVLALAAASGGPAQVHSNAIAFPPLPVEDLGTPVHTMESASFTAYSRSGEPHQLLFFHPMRRPIDCQVRVVNLASGKVVEASGPPDRPLRMVEFEGRYYLGQYGMVGLWIYDPERMSLRFVNGPDLGRLIIFSMTAGPDRKLYLGTASADCRVLQYDPLTERFRDYGTQGPVIKDARYIHSLASDGRFIYSAAGKNPWFLVATEVATGAQRVLLKDAKYLTVHGGDGFATAEVEYPDTTPERDSRATFILKDGRMIGAKHATTDRSGNVYVLPRGGSNLVVFSTASSASAEVPLGKTFDTIWAGPPGAAACSRPGDLVLWHEKTGRVLPVPSLPAGATISALALLPDGRAAFAAAGSDAISVHDPATNSGGVACRVPLPPSASITALVAEGRYLYGATSAPGGIIVDTATWTVTEFPCGGHLARVRGHLRASERGISFPKGNSVFIPARFRLENGTAVPDTSCAGYDMHQQAWMEPDVILDSMRPDGKFTVHWRLPGAHAWKRAAASIQALPVNIERLHALPDGRIFGNTRRYQECFLYTPATRSLDLLPGGFPLSAPCIQTIGGKLYLAGYPGGTLLEYDPLKEWTLGDDPTKRRPPIESEESNPRKLFQFSSLGDDGPAHFVVGSAVGSDGCLYLGGHQERKAVGGGIGWWDLRAAKGGALRQPFLVHECAGLAAVDDGKLLVYSSRVSEDPSGKLASPTGAKLFVFDVPARKLIGEHEPFPGARSTGAILGRGRLIHGFALLDSAWHFYTFDLEKRAVVGRLPIPFPGEVRRPFWGPDRRILFFAGSLLAGVDPETGRFSAFGLVETPGDPLLVGRDLYLAGTPNLRRIVNLTPLPPPPVPAFP